MEVYDRSAQLSARAVTTTFSTSFSVASRFFDSVTRRHIYNIYGLVRIADEIVDTYQGNDMVALLDELEAEVYAAIKRRYSTNVIVHAFMVTATEKGIAAELIRPFFASMRTDIQKKTYTQKQYETYIYGSAEVVGLMCLKVFVGQKEYEKLKGGAAALGAAFQKINFLRDIRDDYEVRGRYYFPIDSYETFSESTKNEIITDIEKDIVSAKIALPHLPQRARRAVNIALAYYQRLLAQLAESSAKDIKSKRMSVPSYEKVLLTAREVVR
jgi:15-cis-phytoene synthase